MIYRILILVFTLFFISCKGHDSDSFNKVIKNDSLYLYDQNKSLRMKARLVNGFKNGEVWEYNENGKLSSISEYHNDTIEGFVWEYYNSGILKSVAYYLEGKKFTNYYEYFDGYQDSIAVLIDGKWQISPRSTKLKYFKFFDLQEKVHYYRYYDINGNLIDKGGKIFQATFESEIIAKKGQTISQGWITPDLTNFDNMDIKQFYVIKNLTTEPVTLDTFYCETDSTVTRWTTKIDQIGNFEFQAIAYLIERGIMETDTSNFRVIVKE